MFRKDCHIVYCVASQQQVSRALCGRTLAANRISKKPRIKGYRTVPSAISRTLLRLVTLSKLEISE